MGGWGDGGVGGVGGVSFTKSLLFLYYCFTKSNTEIKAISKEYPQTVNMKLEKNPEGQPGQNLQFAHPKRQFLGGKRYRKKKTFESRGVKKRSTKK